MLDMIEREKPKVKSEINDFYGKFIVEPLDRGYATTLGNSLRRVLLSSIKGAAVTHIKIDGVLHEFSTIPGVVQDVTEIVMNIKQLKFAMTTEQPKTLKIEVKGEGIVTAADIQPDPEVDILNPDAFICQLTDKNAKLNMELVIAVGKGYVSAEKHVMQEQILGMISVDSIFTPITKVNYSVEDTRVGQITNYDRLIIEIWTDGSIMPHEALSKASEIIRDYMGFFTDLKPPQAPTVLPSVSDRSKVYDIPIEDLGLSVRSLNCLKRASVKVLGDLVALSEDDVMKLKNFGQKSLVEIKEKLEQYDMALLPSVDKEE